MVIMTTKKISATELKRNTADIINEVAFGNKKILVLRHDEVVAEITKPKNKVKDMDYVMKKYGGSMPGLSASIKDFRGSIDKDIDTRIKRNYGK